MSISLKGKYVGYNLKHLSVTYGADHSQFFYDHLSQLNKNL